MVKRRNKIPIETRKLIKQHWDRGLKVSSIASILNLSRHSVYNIVSLIKREGRIHEKKAGRPKHHKITNEIESFIVDSLEWVYGYVTLRELVDLIYEKFNVKLSQDAVRRCRIDLKFKSNCKMKIEKPSNNNNNTPVCDSKDSKHLSTSKCEIKNSFINKVEYNKMIGLKYEKTNIGLSHNAVRRYGIDLKSKFTICKMKIEKPSNNDNNTPVCDSKDSKHLSTSKCGIKNIFINKVEYDKIMGLKNKETNIGQSKPSATQLPKFLSECTMSTIESTTEECSINSLRSDYDSMNTNQLLLMIKSHEHQITTLNCRIKDLEHDNDKKKDYIDRLLNKIIIFNPEMLNVSENED